MLCYATLPCTPYAPVLPQRLALFPVVPLAHVTSPRVCPVSGVGTGNLGPDGQRRVAAAEHLKQQQEREE